MNADRFIESGTKLVYDFPIPVFLIVDGSSARTATAREKYVAATKDRFNLFFLSPHSLPLNSNE
jgi:hypothetical protein